MNKDQMMLELSRNPVSMVRAAASDHPSLRRKIARVLMIMDAEKWDESKHPRREGGKFAPKGGGSGSFEQPLKPAEQRGIMKKPTAKAKSAKLSKREFATLESHARQYMTPAQRKDGMALIQMGQYQYLIQTDEDSLITRVVFKKRVQISRGRKRK